MRIQLVAPFARRHHGLVTVGAAVDAGISRRSFFRAVEVGQLECVHPGVARVPGAPDTVEQKIAAGVLAVGDGAIASHRSAAYLWGVPRPDDDPVDLITPHDRQLKLDGVAIHRPRDRVDLRPIVRRGIPTCTPMRWLCDLGAVDRSGVNPAVGYLLENGVVTASAIWHGITTHSRRGRPGVPALRAALEDWLLDGRILDSQLEKMMRNLVRKYRLPHVEFHAVICGFEVDFWVIGTPIVLECDGFGVHGLKRRVFERDRVKSPELAAAGYIVVPFSYRALERRPQWVATKIRQAVDRWTTSEHASA